MHALRKLLLIALLGAASAAAQARNDAPGRFDYYAVALSWSPSYCATNRDPDQCDSGRKLGFVLHGLWPQYEAGYPEECSREPLSGAVRARYAAIYPSEKLIGHEWNKHGTCSGLDPAAYFALSQRLKDQVAIPRQFQQPVQPVRVSGSDFVQAFRSVNPGMARDSVLPFCSGGGRFLREIHACFDKSGQSRSCSNGEIKRSYSSCRQPSFLLESVR
jgi:ribonuclease T2